MDQDMITDITLDHLPDLSEASVSFQIPHNNASADLLLADHTDGYDLLCNAVDDDASFAPLALRHPRGPPLTLSQLTPRAEMLSQPPRPSRSPTPTQVPSSSAKLSVIQRPLILGHRSPEKRRKTPSRVKLIIRQVESPLVSEERLGQLRAEVETLGQPGEPQSHVQIPEPAENHSVECCSPSRADSKLRNNDNAPESPPGFVRHLDPLPEENETPQDDETPSSAVQDVAMATEDTCPSDATNIAVPRPRPRSKRNPRTSTKPTVAAGGITKRPAVPATHVSKKTKSASTRVREARQLPLSAARQPTPPQSITIDAEQTLVPPACMSGDIALQSENTQITRPSTGGMAERLVSYSQKLISSIGLYKPLVESSLKEASDDAVRAADTRAETRPPATALPPSPPLQRSNDIPIDCKKPFRLSEISPHKPNDPQPSSTANTGTSQEGGQHAMSPMRPAKKRASIDLPQEHHRRKRGKTILANADSERGSSDEAVSQATFHEERPVTQSETARDSNSSRSTLPSARTKYRPKLNSSSQCKGPTLDALPYPPCSRQEHVTINKGKGKRDARQFNAAGARAQPSLSGFSASSRVRRNKTRQGNAPELSHARQQSGSTSTADLDMMEKKQNATLSVAIPRKPVGFTFRVDARLEARKTEERLAESEPGKTRPHHAVPDVKALRASHPAAHVFHREGVAPSVPVPFLFYTEQRAKEREKFDEMVRRKEEETERLKEEQRRREAEEEERAIKELRRKAIPKANEIPEWYADMPKRKGTAV